MIYRPLCMYKIPEDREDFMRFLMVLENTTPYTWSGYRFKPTKFVPKPFGGILSNQIYIFFHKDNTMATGTDIYFFEDSRPKEVKTAKEVKEISNMH